MKKTLLLAGLLVLTTSLLAEKISLAKAFETLAGQFVQTLQDRVKTSVPIISFARESVNQQVEEIKYRFVLNPDSRLIVFDAFLRVQTIGSFSHVDFIFQQVKQGPCSTEYTIIQQPPGCEHCYLQNISLENATYFIPVCTDVNEKTIRLSPYLFF
jgi:hypothetical protein